VNAVFNACGVRIRELPITPDKILMAAELEETSMKAFEWINAASVEEAVQLLKTPQSPADIDDSPRPIAGGQDLLTTHEGLPDAAAAAGESKEHSRSGSH
jgi:hypothetical protein